MLSFTNLKLRVRSQKLTLKVKLCYTCKDYHSDKNLSKRYYNNTVYCSLLLVTILSIAVQSFEGVVF